MADKIFRVNMSDLSTRVEAVPEKWAGLGGRGLTSTIVAAEVKPTCHPLGRHNKLILAPGLLSGTAAANSGRLSCGAKSPLTGTIKEANSGGTSAMMLARLGVKALIIEGKPADEGKWYSLHVDEKGATIAEETEVVGMGNFATARTVNRRLGDKVAVISIGPAGEMRMCAANISLKDPGSHIRAAGRGGLGALMGAKRIKFISVASTDKEVEIADPDAFKAANRTFAKALADNPISNTFARYGTDVLSNIINKSGGLPTRNFTRGQYEGHEGISGETMHKTIVARGGKPKRNCHQGCLIQCSRIYADLKGRGGHKTSGFEYETIWAMGADCCIDNLDHLAEADNLMDDIGIDSIETSVALGVAMEAGVLEFGDGAELCRILREEVAGGTPLGRIIGNGAASVGKAYGITRVPVVKGQAIPAYDPRAIKGIGITYATSTQGADHTMGYTVATNILGVGGTVAPLSKEGQVALSRNLQISTAAIDSTGMCLFIAFAALEDGTCLPALIDMINARFGTSLTAEDITDLGMRILQTERDFNLRAGFTNLDDRLPEFFEEEPIAPHNVVWDISGEAIDSFWDF
jgi:aldehyde:ferredoxin oxidoreductase